GSWRGLGFRVLFFPSILGFKSFLARFNSLRGLPHCRPISGNFFGAKKIRGPKKMKGNFLKTGILIGDDTCFVGSTAIGSQVVSRSSARGAQLGAIPSSASKMFVERVAAWWGTAVTRFRSGH